MPERHEDLDHRAGHAEPEARRKEEARARGERRRRREQHRAGEHAQHEPLVLDEVRERHQKEQARRKPSSVTMPMSPAAARSRPSEADIGAIRG